MFNQTKKELKNIKEKIHSLMYIKIIKLSLDLRTKEINKKMIVRRQNNKEKKKKD